MFEPVTTKFWSETTSSDVGTGAGMREDAGASAPNAVAAHKAPNAKVGKSRKARRAATEARQGVGLMEKKDYPSLT